MVPVLEIQFGQAARDVFERLWERSVYARRLGFQELAPFTSAGQILTLVDAWVPATGGGPSSMDFLELIRTLSREPEALTAAEMIAAPAQLAPITPEQARQVWMQLITGAGALKPQEALALITAQCSGADAMTAAQFLAVCTHLRAQLSATEVNEVLLTRITPPNGKRAFAIHSNICHAGVGGLDGNRFRALIRSWRGVAQGGAGALDSERMASLVAHLRPAAPTPADEPVPTGAQIEQITRWYVSEGNGAANVMAALIAHLVQGGVGAARIREILDALLRSQESPHRVTWLAEAYRHPSNNLSFGQHVQRAIFGNNGAEVGRLLGSMFSRGIPANRASFLLRLFPVVTGDRWTRFDRFLQGALVARDTGIEFEVLTPLERFVLAERRPFGHNGPFAARHDDGADVVPPRDITRPSPHPRGQAQQYRITLHQRWMEHAQNGHTYAHCDFTQRLGLIGVPSIDFWPLDWDDTRIQATLTTARSEHLLAIAARARVDGQGYAGEVYGSVRIGMAPRHHPPDGIRRFAVTHLMPFGAHAQRVSMRALRAISNLFD